MSIECFERMSPHPSTTLHRASRYAPVILAAALAMSCAHSFGPYAAPEDQFGYKGDLAPKHWAGSLATGGITAGAVLAWRLRRPTGGAAAQATGIDLSAAMLARASKRSARLNIPVELLEMDALTTTFPDRHFD